MGRRPAWRAHHDVRAVDRGVDGAFLHAGGARVERLLRELPCAKGFRASVAEQGLPLPEVAGIEVRSVRRLDRGAVRAGTGALRDESEIEDRS